MEELEFHPQLLPFLLKREEFQTAILLIVINLEPLLKKFTVMQRILDKILLIVKRLLISGEKDQPLHLDQLFCSKTQLISITTLLTLVILLLQSRNNTINKKMIDKLLLMHKKLLMHGEQDLPQVQDLCKDKTQLMLILMAQDLETSQMI